MLPKSIDETSSCATTEFERFTITDHRGSYLQMHFALDDIPEVAEPYGLLNDPAMQSDLGIFSTRVGVLAVVPGPRCEPAVEWR